jgi:eukaryotic-like serine/threonine-protein kinase
VPDGVVSVSLLSNLKARWAGNKVNVRERFELLREAISGTMSSFYMARDRQLDRIVGLKILDPVKTAALEARFTGLKKPREGEIASQFHHPFIVETLAHGMTTNNEQFIVMEFLDGPGLNSLIVARNKLAGRRLALLRQAAEALSVVHKAGFIHRDVCPRNFVVAKDLDKLKLIDFGLSVPATGPYLQPGNRTGTANYMAPEVVRRRPTSQRLDIFAFGVTAFELFAFDLPWPRGADGLAAMAHGVDQHADIRKSCPRIHPTLAAAIESCLESAPEKRPESMDKLLQMIRSVDREEV